MSARSRLVLGGCALLAGCASAADPTPSPATPGGPAYVTKAPVETDAADAGVGAEVAFDYVDLDGQPGDLATLATDRAGVVVVFTSLQCPVTRLYAPTLAERAAGWTADGLAVLVVDPAPQDDTAELRARAEDLGWTFPVARDPGFAITAALGAERTAACFLIDADRRLVYRGALDDQYGINYRRVAPRHRYLDDAVAALLAGRAPAVAATDAPGCLLR